MKSLTSIPAISFLLDLIWIAEHPGDRVVYRHLCLMPFSSSVWTDGVPPPESMSSLVAARIASLGFVGFLRQTLSELAGSATDAEAFLSLAEEYERMRPLDRTLGDFRFELEKTA